MGKGKHPDNHEEEELDVAVPPDGGWGWMVVLGSFALHVIADGIVYSFGVFYIDFLDYFKGGKGETSWVGSLVPGVTLTVGPIASALTNRYGCRVVTIAGALIASLGFILSLFAPNIYYLYFSFGIMSGLGFGLMYLPAIVSVGHYFEKKRSFATGIAVCGSGVGTFIFAPLSKVLLDEYTWRGATLIEAGIILNCVIFGVLFRPLLPTKKSKKKYDVEANGKSEKEALMRENGDGKRSSLRIPSVSITTEPSSPSSLVAFDANKILTRIKVEQNGIAQMVRSDGALHKMNGYSSSPPSSPTSNVAPVVLRSGTFRRQHSTMSSTSHLSPLARKDIFYSGSLINIPQYKSNPDLYVTSVLSIPEQVSNEDDWFIFRCLNLSPEVRDAVRQMLDFSLLKDPIFLLFVVSNFFTSIGFNMPYIYLPDRALEAGISKTDAALLVSVIGIANTIGRVVFGWMADQKWVNRLMLYSTALTICGIATALSPLSNSFEYLLVYAAVFGAFIGVYVGLTSVVLVDLLGLDKLTSAFGLLLMFQGVATLIGPPIAGWLYDATGSYDISFQLCGTVVAVSGFMLYSIPLIQKCLGRTGPPGKAVEFTVDVDSNEVEGDQSSPI
ncbi:monocarboxylate transporter 7-like [Mizuhopecten yessoensis]|uniref:Monocarboxylate transporter 12 n=1 Tax=Mizuhopecten yessoensis TaxID=6573 RepID=A0A210R6J4_MIZYE|nr:monocarboxylate transporter 7-like [Mizuhopecten yessoensis]XP_021376316.1 monocarboxylate transporter 7-like [Mizuhopecten yessoensis]XP_021376390.1 monocarboxylate transporter 7-like [Mizuhopecten yessoensis]XP_021376478.1 monocarboxylate transporter 7-like [Mizuhopecten yessoensis]OWF56683.1 Monocarboxylate transporter 12 [Mizuhopecten yessoensis]